MKAPSSFILSLLLVFALLTACTNIQEEAMVDDQQTSQNQTAEDPGPTFAAQLAGTYEGHCCEHNVTEDAHATYRAINEVTLANDLNADLNIDGTIFHYVSGSDIDSEDIVYRSNEGYGVDVRFRKNATILQKDVSISTPTETIHIGCETYRDAIDG